MTDAAEHEVSASERDVPAREWLTLVPGCERGEPPLAIAWPTQGVLNRVWRITTREGDFALRVAKAWAPGVDRHREELLQSAAAHAGLAPQIVASRCGSGAEVYVLVSEWIDAPRLDVAEMTTTATCAALGATLASLHALEPPDLPPFDFCAAARAYGAGTAELERLETDVARSHSNARPPCIVHLDLHHTNVLASGRHLLLDWEFAAVGDPLLDLSCWIAYYPGAAAHADRLLEESGLAGVATRAQLLDQAAAFARLCRLWTEGRTGWRPEP
jgi:aminoglycoside phosphotransferase (APT) family kinase protein